MNYIIKKVLKKILTQYLYIRDDGIDLSSGIIRLPQGNINHNKINEILKTFKMHITESSYKNLTVHIPIIELLSKPIKISIQTLDITVEKLPEEGIQRRESESQIQIEEEDLIRKGERRDQVQRSSELEKQVLSDEEKKQSSGYFRNIVNRLLYNMEIFMERINIKLIDYKEQQEFREAFFTLNSMSLKNSLIILEANIIKKTLNLQLFHLRHSFGEIQIKDLNICFDFNNKKISLIAILSSLQVDLYKFPLKKITKKLSKKIANPPEKESLKTVQSDISDSLDLSIFFKINQSHFCSKILKIQFSTIESTIKKNSLAEDISINFNHICLKNSANSSEDESLLEIRYLPNSSEVKIYSQYQDNIIKHTLLNISRELEPDKTSISAKVYHLNICLNLSEFKCLLDTLLKYQRQIIRINKILQRYSKKESNLNHEDGHFDSRKTNINFLLYRLLLQVKYENIETKLFGSMTLTTVSSEGSPLSNSSKHKKRSSKKSQESEIQQLKKGQKVQYKLNILQLGVNIAYYNICQISELQCLYDFEQVIVTGCTICIEGSLKLVDNIQQAINLVKRDSIYYSQKIKKVLLIEDKDQILLSQQSKQSEENQRGEEIKDTIPNIYFKFNQIELQIGELSTRVVREMSQSKKDKPKYIQSSVFIPIVQVQLINTLFSFVSQKLKVRSDISTYLYSPYTLQRNPITNELQISVTHHLTTQESNITLNNNLIVLINDQYINILYKLFDKDNIWCLFRNLTHEEVTFIQETNTFESLLPEEKEQFINQNDPEVYYHSIKIDMLKTHQIFWLNDQNFKLFIGKRKTEPILLNKHEDLIDYNSTSQIYESTQQILFQDGRQSGYLLKLLYNKLGNLLEMKLDYKASIVSYSKKFVITLGGNHYPIIIDPQYSVNPSIRKAISGHWYHLLQDSFQNPHEITLTANEDVKFSLQSLVANQQFTIFGLYETSKKQMGKLYSSYLLQTTVEKMLHFTIMPFLIIKNEFEFDIEIEIVEKKSQQKESFVMKKQEKRQFNCNQQFDYYMKQFIIKLCLVTDKASYESDQFYFNTFTMVDQVTETNIQLRSTAKQDYSKKTILFQEGLVLKTKVITLKKSARIVNLSDYTFCFKVKENSKEDKTIDQLFVDKKEVKEWCCKLKKDTIIEAVIVNLVENKIEFTYGEIRSQKVLSFNFCKIEDKFYNLLVKIQSRSVEGVEIIELENFVEIVNLCHYVQSFKIQSQDHLQYEQKQSLLLNSTSMNKYNNKVVQLDDMNKIYAEIFLTAKVTDHPLKINLNDYSISFCELVKHTCLELMLGSNRYVFTLLKDMNYNRMTFYLTDRLYNQKMNYTIFNNQTPQHFLLSDDTEYSHHFIIEPLSREQSRLFPPEKIFIQHNSFNCMISKQNHDLLLCDKDQKHLEKIEKRILSKINLRIQQHQFQHITLYDCQQEHQKEMAKKQLSTKAVQIRFKMLNKIELTMGIQGLTLRSLENGKLDCLIQDISIRNEQTKDHLLRIPEETYLLLQGKVLDECHFLFIKNAFLKCKNIIVNIKRQMPYSIINLAMNLGERMGIRLPEEMEVLEPRRLREKIKKFDGENRLKKYINEQLLLVKNIFIHEIHLSLSIQLENLSFSNVIILPHFEMTSKFIREKSFKGEIVTFYLTNLLAKFPKLSFLMTNFKSPINTIKLFFNIRDAMKQKFHPHPIIYFQHQELPENPFLLSIERWNNINNYLSKFPEVGLAKPEKLISFIHQNKKYLILTNHHIIYLQEDEYQDILLTDLENVKILKNRINSQIIMRFKNGDRLALVEDQKKCLKFLNRITQLLL